MEHDRFKEALNKQREEDSKLLEAKIAAELERQNRQLEVEYKYVCVALRLVTKNTCTFQRTSKSY